MGAALDMATGEVIGSLDMHHRAAEFKRLLARIDEEVPAHLDVHLVLDNYATHKTPETGERGRRSRLPPSGDVFS